MSLRIVHLAGTPNGAPWLIGILKEQKRRGHDVRAVIASSDGTIAPALEREGIPYDTMYLGLSDRGSSIDAGKRVFAVARYLRELRADVVMYHLFPSIVIGRLSSWLADAPMRFSMIPSPLFLESPYLSDIEAATAWADTRVIATCEKTRTLYRERNIANGKVEMTFYGVDETAFDPATASRTKLRHELGIAADTPVIGMVAYFYAPNRNQFMTPPFMIGRGAKGHDVLFEAIPRVLAEFPNAKFVLVGKGWLPPGLEYEQELRQMVADMGLQDAVIFAGERSDIPDTLAAFDIALQCSLTENLGGSIEGLLMERPMVVTRVGGFTDSVLHEKTGLLVPHSDPAALSEAILRLLRDRAFAATLGANGRRWMMERFTLRRTCDDLDEIYQRCAPKRRGYSLLWTLLRIPQLPFRVAPMTIKIELARFRNLTLRRIAGAVKRRILGRQPA
ncbi:MAG TPA: glycosyltransferase [Thermoanaerobaculia bacterium]|jgi:glycosyltransferase involved in cell wall biosynthesis